MTTLPTNTPSIDLDHLSVRLGPRTILSDLDARLQGRSIGLLGPNGAGKSTLMQTLLGFHGPSSGTARIFGLDIVSEARRIRHDLGYMPENDAFVTGMSGIRLVRMMGELSGLPPHVALERSHETLFFLGLGEARYRNVETYSLGMKQLTKLAVATVHGPRMLILDEPTNGLDASGRARMIDIIRTIRDSGHTRILLSSHLLRDVEECCDEVVILRDGRLVQYANLEEERRTNRKFLNLEIQGEGGGFVETARQRGCEIAVNGTRRIKMILPEHVEVTDLYRIAVATGVEIQRLSAKRDSLEDIFMKAMDDSVPEVSGKPAASVRVGGRADGRL